jgi:hypothetical protein
MDPSRAERSPSDSFMASSSFVKVSQVLLTPGGRERNRSSFTSDRGASSPVPSSVSAPMQLSEEDRVILSGGEDEEGWSDAEPEAPASASGRILLQPAAQRYNLSSSSSSSSDTAEVQSVFASSVHGSEAGDSDAESGKFFFVWQCPVSNLLCNNRLLSLAMRSIVLNVTQH